MTNTNEIIGWRYELAKQWPKVACADCVSGLGSVTELEDGTWEVQWDGAQADQVAVEPVEPVTELEPGTFCAVCDLGGEVTEWDGERWLSTLDGAVRDDDGHLHVES